MKHRFLAVILVLIACFLSGCASREPSVHTAAPVTGGVFVLPAPTGKTITIPASIAADYEWLIQDPVVLSDITYTGESMLEDANTYIEQKWEDITKPHGENAFIGDPIFCLQLDDCSIASDRIFYPIIDGNTDLIRAIIYIYQTEKGLTRLYHNNSGPWFIISKELEKQPKKQFLYCRLKGSTVVISSDNEILPCPPIHERIYFTKEIAPQLPEECTYSEYILSLFDENINYFDALKNEDILITYESTIGKLQK